METALNKRPTPEEGNTTQAIESPAPLKKIYLEKIEKQQQKQVIWYQMQKKSMEKTVKQHTEIVAWLLEQNISLDNPTQVVKMVKGKLQNVKIKSRFKQEFFEELNSALLMYASVNVDLLGFLPPVVLNETIHMIPEKGDFSERVVQLIEGLNFGSQENLKKHYLQTKETMVGHLPLEIRKNEVQNILEQILNQEKEEFTKSLQSIVVLLQNEQLFIFFKNFYLQKLSPQLLSNDPSLLLPIVSTLAKVDPEILKDFYMHIDSLLNSIDESQIVKGGQVIEIVLKKFIKSDESLKGGLFNSLALSIAGAHLYDFSSSSDGKILTAIFKQNSVLVKAALNVNVSDKISKVLDSIIIQEGTLLINKDDPELGVEDKKIAKQNLRCSYLLSTLFSKFVNKNTALQLSKKILVFLVQIFEYFTQYDGFGCQILTLIWKKMKLFQADKQEELKNQYYSSLIEIFKKKSQEEISDKFLGQIDQVVTTMVDTDKIEQFSGRVYQKLIQSKERLRVLDLLKRVKGGEIYDTMVKVMRSKVKEFKVDNQEMEGEGEVSISESDKNTIGFWREVIEAQEVDEEKKNIISEIKDLNQRLGPANKCSNMLTLIVGEEDKAEEGDIVESGQMEKEGGPEEEVQEQVEEVLIVSEVEQQGELPEGNDVEQKEDIPVVEGLEPTKYDEDPDWKPSAEVVEEINEQVAQKTDLEEYVAKSDMKAQEEIEEVVSEGEGVEDEKSGQLDDQDMEQEEQIEGDEEEIDDDDDDEEGEESVVDEEGEGLDQEMDEEDQEKSEGEYEEEESEEEEEIQEIEQEELPEGEQIEEVQNTIEEEDEEEEGDESDEEDNEEEEDQEDGDEYKPAKEEIQIAKQQEMLMEIVQLEKEPISEQATASYPIPDPTLPHSPQNESRQPPQ